MMDPTNWSLATQGIFQGLNQISLTSWIAIYGAILATVTLLWNFIKETKDKPRLLVKYYTAIAQGVENEQYPLFAINVSNTGRHKIIVSSLGFSLKNKNSIHFMQLMSELPKEINPNDSYDFLLDIKKISDSIQRYGEPKKIWVKDKVGRKYFGSTKYLKSHVDAMLRAFQGR